MNKNITPLPWKVNSFRGIATLTLEGGGTVEYPICQVYTGNDDKEETLKGVALIYGDTYEEQTANAEFIVRACNSHEQLVEALEAVAFALLASAQALGPIPQMLTESVPKSEVLDVLTKTFPVDKIRAALAAAKGEPKT